MKKLVFFGLLRQADQLPVKYGDYAITIEDSDIALRYKGGLVKRFEFDEAKSKNVLFEDLRLSDKFAGIADLTQSVSSFGVYSVIREDKIFKLVLNSVCLGEFELTDTQIEVFSRDVLAFAKYLRYEVL